jgi:ATP-dependent Clp protease ATP-binding subunit ClpB
VLFDEIEKAHPDVLNILLQVLDDGVITDAQGRQINFENTVIIMTTNAGSETSTSISGFSENRELQSKAKVEKALLTFLRPEFINRIDEIVVFRHLDEHNFVDIAGIMMGKLADHLAEKGISLTYNSDLLSYIAKGAYSEKYGARNMNRFIERNVEDKLAEALIEHDLVGVTNIDVFVEDNKIKIATNC